MDLRNAIKLAKGQRRVAEATGVSQSAVSQWIARGKLPRTEWTGETRYAEIIVELSNGRVTKDQLLAGGLRSNIGKKI